MEEKKHNFFFFPIQRNLLNICTQYILVKPRKLINRTELKRLMVRIKTFKITLVEFAPKTKEKIKLILAELIKMKI